MKKFLTVLLVIAVMFTFSFGSTIAYADGGNLATNTQANMIKQAADYVKAGMPEAVEKAYKSVLSGGTANTYITEAAWEAASAEIVSKLNDSVDTLKADKLADTSGLTTGWDSYDYIYAASVIFADYTYTKLAQNFAVNNEECPVIAAKEQFKIDLADAMAIYDKVDLDALYSKAEPTTGKTYYQQASEIIESNKTILKDYYVKADGSVQNAGNTVSEIKSAGKGLENAVYSGGTLGSDKLNAIEKEMYEGTSIVKYYKVANIPTLDSLKVDEALNAAKTAALKAQIAENVALYLNTTGGKTEAGKNFAADYSTLYSYLAEEIPANTTLASYVAAHKNNMDKDAYGGWANTLAAAIEKVAKLETEAAKYAAEKDSTGALVRDTAEVNKLVKKAKSYHYATAAGITDASITAYTTDSALTAIKAMTTSGDAAKLAFDKEAEKAKLDSYMNGTASSIPSGFAKAEDYYDLEAEAVKTAYEAAKTKVDAAEKTDDFATIETALKKDLAKIKDEAAVEALFSTGKMSAELTTQASALVAYVQYKNSAVQTYDDAYILTGSNTTATAVRVLTKYYIENNARTVEEMQALTGAVEAAAATLPTNASKVAAKKAADDAIKALPSAAKTTSADKEVYQNAFDLAEAYNELVETETGTAGTLEIPEAQVEALVGAIQSDIQLAYAKADKNDKAALKAIADEVEALNDTVDSDALFTAKFTDPTTTALSKIRTTEKDAVIAAINAIPLNVTEADKATVQKARELYDAYVKEYTDPTDAENGYAAADFDAYYHDLALAEAALGLNDNSDADAKAYVQDLKIKARSVKTSKGVKVTINADVQSLLDGGFTVEYKFYRSTKSNKNFGTAKIVKTENTYLNTSGTKGTKYYYKAKLVVKNAKGEVVATTPLTQCLYASRTF